MSAALGLRPIPRQWCRPGPTILPYVCSNGPLRWPLPASPNRDEVDGVTDAPDGSRRERRALRPDESARAAAIRGPAAEVVAVGDLPVPRSLSRHRGGRRDRALPKLRSGVAVPMPWVGGTSADRLVPYAARSPRRGSTVDGDRNACSEAIWRR